MKIVEDEIIGELRYLTVKFDTIELMAGGVGVISQGTVRRYFEKKNPDLKVKKCGGLKLDYQEETVAMRFGVVKESTTVEPIVKEVKLLNPEYNELKEEYNKLLEKYNYQISGVRQAKYDEAMGYYELAAQVEGLKEQLELGATVYDELKAEYDELLARNAALVEAVCKDAQKFSDLLVENEALKKQNVALAECAGIDISPEAPNVQIGIKDKETDLSPIDKEAIRIGEDALQIPPITEDSADLADAKEVIESADSVPLSEESENV